MFLFDFNLWMPWGFFLFVINFSFFYKCIYNSSSFFDLVILVMSFEHIVD